MEGITMKIFSDETMEAYRRETDPEYNRVRAFNIIRSDMTRCGDEPYDLESRVSFLERRIAALEGQLRLRR